MFAIGKGKTCRPYWKIKGEGCSNMQPRQNVSSEGSNSEKHGECACEPKRPLLNLWGACLQLVRLSLEPSFPCAGFPRHVPLPEQAVSEGRNCSARSKEKVRHSLTLTCWIDEAPGPVLVPWVLSSVPWLGVARSFIPALFLYAWHHSSEKIYST